MDGWTEGWMEGWMDGWMDGCMHGWMDGRREGWMEGWMDVGMDGRARITQMMEGSRTDTQAWRPYTRQEMARLTLPSTPRTMACSSAAWTGSLEAAARSYRSCAARKPSYTTGAAWRSCANKGGRTAQYIYM